VQVDEATLQHRSLCDLPRWALPRWDGRMAIDLRSLQSAVRITGAGDLLGTGFLVKIPAGELLPGKWISYLVTAHHVIANQIEIAAEVPDALSIGTLYPPKQVVDWRQPLPGVDLAVAPFPMPLDMRFQANRLEWFLPPDELPPLGAMIFYIGMFAPKNIPMARSGTVGAVMVPMEIDGYRYDAHLVDCRSYGGFSGSPCFVETPYTRIDARIKVKDVPETLAPLASVTQLCGMFTAHYSDEKAPDAEGAVSRYGVGVMLRSDQIREALMTDDMQAERNKSEAEAAEAIKRATPSAENASVVVDDEASEYERFEDLTRKLVNTPKAAPEKDS
jgi:hypothetical protein